MQDLASHDWEILDKLLKSRLDLLMAGDIRQAVLSTNPRSRKDKTYAYADSIKWFREREKAGFLCVTERSESWRCRPEIAAFSDSIFDSQWSFPITHSRNLRVTDHDGVFVVNPTDVVKYIEAFDPKCLRHGATSAKEFDLDFTNFGEAKGLSFERVLIFPTGPIERFIRTGKYLDPRPASRFYVAVTRAFQSVGVVMKPSGTLKLPVWEPPN